MYICARGRLEVVVDNGKTVLATLKAGSYFGEISILNMGAAGEKKRFSSSPFRELDKLRQGYFIFLIFFLKI